MADQLPSHTLAKIRAAAARIVERRPVPADWQIDIIAPLLGPHRTQRRRRDPAA